MQDKVQDDEINLLEYWNIIWRRKYILIAFFIISVSITMYISMKLPKFYKSDAIIITSGADSGGLGAALSGLPLGGLAAGLGGVQTPADKIMIILRSRTMAETVINKFNLMTVFYDKLWDPVQKTWKNRNQPPMMEDAVRLLTTEIAKFNKSKEGAITISVEWKNPELAAEIANFYITALSSFLNEKSINVTIQVVDKAVPSHRKSRPKIASNMILAGFTSLIIGIFVAFFLEFTKKQKETKVLQLENTSETEPEIRTS